MPVKKGAKGTVSHIFSGISMVKGVSEHYNNKILILCVFSFGQKYSQKGVMIGAVKGSYGMRGRHASSSPFFCRENGGNEDELF